MTDDQSYNKCIKAAQLGQIGDARKNVSISLLDYEGNVVTLYKSLGIAIQDLAAAHHIYTQAVAQGAGVSVPLGPDPAHPPG